MNSKASILHWLLKLREVCRLQRKSPATEQAYAGWARRYMMALYQMPPGLSSEKKLEHFLTALSSRVSASTQNQAFNAIRFLYDAVLQKPLGDVQALRANRPSQIRHAPTVEETFRLLNSVGNAGGYPTNLLVRMLYGCGLRVSEPLNLRVKDLQPDRLFIMGGKGCRDRVVSLPCSLAIELQGQLVFAKAVWQRDQAGKIPVALPEGLAKKYPEYRFAWQWAWVFPSRSLCRHPRTGELVRWRCHEANVQRAIKTARRNLGICVLPHELRHAYATHCLERGTNLKALQAAMGHKQIETTIGYCHADALSVASPLESSAPSRVYPAGATRVYPGQDDLAGSLCEPAGSHIAICEPIKSSELRAFDEVCTNPKLLTQELDKPGPDNGDVANAKQRRHAADRDLVQRAFSIVGARTQEKHGGWYWNRVRENRSKFERVLNAVALDRRERAAEIVNWGGHFYDLWSRFAD